MNRYIVALTGASGIIYGLRLIAELLNRDYEVHLIASEAACIVIEHELNWEFAASREATFQQYFASDKLYYYDCSDIAAVLASGSFITDSMVIIPCTMATVSAIANGSSRSLLERAADVMLKEKRPLIMVPRETPLSTLHLKNMLSLSEMGVHIVPAMPAFYTQPQSIDDMVDFMVGKVMDIMHIEHNIFKRYED